MAQMLIRSPDNLKAILQDKAKDMGITLNALLLQILWQWAEQQK